MRLPLSRFGPILDPSPFVSTSPPQSHDLLDRPFPPFPAAAPRRRAGPEGSAPAAALRLAEGRPRNEAAPGSLALAPRRDRPHQLAGADPVRPGGRPAERDRKSTRLNSSH